MCKSKEEKGVGAGKGIYGGTKPGNSDEKQKKVKIVWKEGSDIESVRVSTK